MKGIKKIGNALFSLYVWSASFALMTLIWVATVVLLPVVPYVRSHSWIASPGFALCLRLAWTRVRVIYDPKFDRSRRNVFCMNHTNLLDAHTASSAIPHPYCGLMHAWQFKIPIYGWMMGLSHGIKVHPGKGKANLAHMNDEAKKRREMGMSILTFPEGHRTRDGKVHRFHAGPLFMAREAGYPVVPIAVRGMFAVNKKGSMRFTPGKVTVYVGPQFETAGKTDQEIKALTQELQLLVSKFVESENIHTSERVAA